MNVLFVCSANKTRSKTAETYFADLVPENNYTSCGINKYLCEKNNGRYICQELFDANDLIVLMSKTIERVFHKKFSDLIHNNIIVIDINDFKDPEDVMLAISKENTLINILQNGKTN